ncbi:MAG: hypothetical protein IJX74_04025 [Clostridia bacterium]|nr:hypothetical protein [Clostridia bacterium]
MTAVLISCNSTVTVEDVVGLYTGEYEYEENQFYVTIRLNEDSTYLRMIYKNGEFRSQERGDYEIDGSTVRLYDMTSGAFTEYRYLNGVLTNNGHKFVR